MNDNNDRIIDAEILPSETGSDSTGRAYASGMAVRDPLAVTVTISIPNSEPAHTMIPRGYKIDPHDLWIGAYNLLHEKPDLADFQPAAKWSDQDRAAIGLGPKRPHRTLLPSAIGDPLTVPDRVGLAPMQQRGAAHIARIMVRNDVDTAYVTHLAIGSKADGIITAVQLAEPLKVIGGHHVVFGIVLGDNMGIEGSRGRKQITD